MHMPLSILVTVYLMLPAVLPAQIIQSTYEGVTSKALSRAEYLIITAPGFRQEAERLTQFRRTQGVVAAVITTDQVYLRVPQEGHSAQSVRSLLEDLFRENPGMPLKYLVLLGKAPADSRQQGTEMDAAVPAFRQISRDGKEIWSDNPYSRINDGRKEHEIFVGRIPAATVMEARQAVSRIIAYESYPLDEPWRNKVLWVGNEDHFLSRTPAALSVYQVKHERVGGEGGQQPPAQWEVANYWNEGVAWVNFAEADVLPDAFNKMMFKGLSELINNTQSMPFVTAFVGGGAAGELAALLRGLFLGQHEGGVVGYWMWSGISPDGNARQLEEAVVSLWDENLRLGEISSLLRRRFMESQSPPHNDVSSDLLHRLTLVGDPFTPVNWPAPELGMIAGEPTSLSAGDTLSLEFLPPRETSGGYLELIGVRGELLLRIPLSAGDVQRPFSIRIPQKADPGSLLIRCFLSDGYRGIRGSLEIEVSQPAVPAFVAKENPLPVDSPDPAVFLRHSGIDNVARLSPRPGFSTLDVPAVAERFPARALRPEIHEPDRQRRASQPTKVVLTDEVSEEPTATVHPNSGGKAQLSARPSLLPPSSSREHTSEEDSAGFLQQALQLHVDENIGIRVYGNYPNPFEANTIFAYEIESSQILDKFEIVIYSLNGRLVRRIDSDANNPVGAADGGAARPGYNELMWDGRNESGEEVANGVYFAVVRGILEKQIVEHTLKVAKLR